MGRDRVRTVGVEEEYLLADPVDGTARPDAPRVLQVLAPGHGESELHREQVETGSTPHTSLAALRTDLLGRRRELAAAARDSGSALLALGTHPVGGEPTLSPGPRYERLRERFGLLSREQLTCGCHVHVGVTDRDEGAVVLDRLRPWAPVLLALSGNSPYWQGVDTGHASYRSRVWDRWPTAGPGSAVGDAAGYDALVRRVLATGVPLDPGMVYFDVRLSARYPTVEVRVADVCLRVDDAVLLAALVRALADTAVAEHRAGRPVPDVGVEVLRLASWRAARDGVDGELVHPLTGTPRPAGQVVADLLEHVAPALARNGDEDAVRAGAAAVLQRGTGARWQRAAVAAGGVPSMLRGAARLTLDRAGEG
ncbi:glutamate--cysteine ligase [Kineococcus sp. TRM81007]|uniref:carboxylate-amine ligase n=1 Tax=Kineococcus sp. TRM81007 TaxID=2925831 RepID=UPI001F5715F0|nr:glutamate--cysteine ligase [Kineococcus sp. TRM81007]MCI2237673.1 glutamate--cysteine ligase [Kineococcus sp. TRM81007]